MILIKEKCKSKIKWSKQWEWDTAMIQKIATSSWKNAMCNSMTTEENEQLFSKTSLAHQLFIISTLLYHFTFLIYLILINNLLFHAQLPTLDGHIFLQSRAIFFYWPCVGLGGDFVYSSLNPVRADLIHSLSYLSSMFLGHLSHGLHNLAHAWYLSCFF